NIESTPTTYSHYYILPLHRVNIETYKNVRF
ncbi:MAG: hypothetical protein ACI9QL_005060, partial [Candidatus Omnitrophota bacterium]